MKDTRIMKWFTGLVVVVLAYVCGSIPPYNTFSTPGDIIKYEAQKHEGKIYGTVRCFTKNVEGVEQSYMYVGDGDQLVLVARYIDKGTRIRVIHKLLNCRNFDYLYYEDYVGGEMVDRVMLGNMIWTKDAKEFDEWVFGKC